MIQRGLAHSISWMSLTTAGAANTATVPSVTINKDNAGQSSAGVAAPVHQGNGEWSLALTGTQMDAAKVAVTITGVGLQPRTETIHTESSWTAARAALVDQIASSSTAAANELASWGGLGMTGVVAASTPGPTTTSFVVDFAPDPTPTIDNFTGLYCGFTSGTLAPDKKPIASYDKLTASTARLTFRSRDAFGDVPTAGDSVTIL
jgi:hypothetical protein